MKRFHLLVSLTVFALLAVLIYSGLLGAVVAYAQELSGPNNDGVVNLAAAAVATQVAIAAGPFGLPVWATYLVTAVYMMAEAWLGQTNKVKAGSVLELLGRVILAPTGLLKKDPPPPAT